MFNFILLRYGEIFLKGKNRVDFEGKLIDNIKKKNSVARIQKTRNRLVIPYFSQHRSLTEIFGLISYSPAAKAEKDINSIQEKAVQVVEFTAQSSKNLHKSVKKANKITFRVETKRSDKTFPLKSPEMNAAVGKFIEEKTSLKFSFEHPDIILGIEINEEGAYVFSETYPCFGGLPAGVEGKALLLVENEASLLAGLLFMKRGGQIFPVSFAHLDISLLQEFSPVKLKLKLINNFDECDSFARENNIDVLISGQNFDKFSGIKHSLRKEDTSLLVFRPLISYSDERINEQLAEFNCTICRQD